MLTHSLTPIQAQLVTHTLTVALHLFRSPQPQSRAVLFCSLTSRLPALMHTTTKGTLTHCDLLFSIRYATVLENKM